MRIYLKIFEGEIISSSYGKELPCGADLADGGWMGEEWAFSCCDSVLYCLSVHEEDGMTELWIEESYDYLDDLEEDKEHNFIFDTETKKIELI